MAVIGLIGLILGIVQNEIFTADDNPLDADIYIPLSCEILRYIITFSTIPLVILIFVKSWFTYTYSQLTSASNIQSKLKYLSSSDFKLAVFEALINAVHCPPSVNGYIPVWTNSKDAQGNYKMSVSTLLTIIMLLRIYLLFRLFIYFTKLQRFAMTGDESSAWYNNRVNLILKKNNLFGKDFEIKMFLTNNTFLTLIVGFFLTAFFFGYAIRAFERPINAKIPLKNRSYQNYGDFWSGMWLTFIAMTTVGYGDLYPKTHIGRALCMMANIIGITLISMLTVALNQALVFTEPEKNAFTMINKWEMRSDFKNKAVECIVKSYRYYKCKSAKSKESSEEFQRVRDEKLYDLNCLLDNQKIDRELVRRESEAINKRTLLLKIKEEKKNDYKYCLSLIKKMSGKLKINMK